MAETAAPEQQLDPMRNIKTLIGDPNFAALSMADKMVIWERRVKDNKEFQQLVPDPEERLGVFESILQENMRRRLATSGETQGDQLNQRNWRVSMSEPGPGNARPVSELQTEPGGPVGVTNPEQEAVDRGNPFFTGEDPNIVSRAGVRAADSFPGMAAHIAGSAVRVLGGAAVGSGLVAGDTEPELTKNIGTALQEHPYAQRPLESLLTGGKGYPPLAPGYAALEHVLSAALGAAAPTAIVAKIYPLLRSGEIVPTVDQIKKAMLLAAQGATFGELAKLLGAPGWAQLVVEFVGGLGTPKDLAIITKTVYDSPGLSRYIRQKHDKILTNKTTEYFGGPKLREQYEGGTATLNKQQGKLADFVGSEIGKVESAETGTQRAAARFAGEQERGRTLDLESKAKVNAATQIASEEISTIETQAKQIDDAIQATRDDMSAGVREQRAALIEKRAALAEEHKQALRKLQDTHKSVEDAHAAINTGQEADLAAMQDQLTHITVANQRDIDASLDYAAKNAREISPPMAEANTGYGSRPDRESVGRQIIKKTGETGTELHEAVAGRLKSNAERIYGQISRDSQVAEESGTLRSIVERYRPTLEEGSVPTTQFTGTYAPKSAVDAFDHRIQQDVQTASTQPDYKPPQASTPGGQAPDPKDVVILTLNDLQDFRSRLLDDLRHAPYGSQRRTQLANLATEVDGYMDTLAVKYPESVKPWREANAWYRTEKLRLTGEPGHLTLERNPFTGERVNTPDEIARDYFGTGPTVRESSGAAAQRERNFTTYLNTLNDIITEASIPKAVTVAGVHIPIDIRTVAAAIEAKNSLFDMVKAQFYNAAFDIESNAFNPRGSADWLRTHGALLEANPELKAIFQTPKERLVAIRDVQAKAQSIAALPEAALQAMQETIAAQKLGGAAQVRESAQALQVGKDAADVLQTRSLAEQRQKSADLREQAALGNQFTRDQKLEAARGRDAALERARREPELVKAEQENLKVVQDERIRLAKEAQANMAKNEAAVVADFEATFPGRAAKRARQDEHFAESMGQSPDAIVQQIEAISSPADKNAAWAQWMKKAGNDEELKTAILQARWRNFLGGKDIITDPGKAAAFISEPGMQEWLKRYYPDYLTNIKRVQSAFERMEALYKDSPLDFNKKSLFRHAGLSGTLVYMSHIFGFNWTEAVGLGLVSEGVQHMLYRRKIGALSQIYLDPHDLDLIAKITRVGTPINVINQVAWSIFTRANIIAQESSGETR